MVVRSLRPLGGDGRVCGVSGSAGETGCQEVHDRGPFIGNPAGLWEQLESEFEESFSLSLGSS